MKINIIKVLRIILEVLYFPFKILPTGKKITFISRQSDEKSIDILLLEHRIEKEIPDCEVVVLTKTLNDTFKSRMGYCFHIFKQMYHISTSKIVILDSYCLPICMLHHKKSLIVIQMWHALGLMKKAGYSILNKPEGRSYSLAKAMKLHKNYDIIFASSEACRKAMGEVFGYNEDKVQVYPLPRVDLLRNDSFLRKDRIRITNEHPELRKKKNVLYAPTYRKDESLMREQIGKIISQFPFEQYNLIINLHPLSQVSISDERVIIDHSFTTLEWIAVADYVISDYSSIIYEAAIMKKSLFFFAFDLDEYKVGREFFIDYEHEVPGKVYKNVSELIQGILTYKYNQDSLNLFVQKYVLLNRNDCTGEIVKLLQHLLQPECFFVHQLEK